MKKAIALIAAAAGLTVAPSALAIPTFVFTVGDQLFVKTGGNMNQYTLADDITGLAVAPNGTIYASSSSDNGSNGTTELYTLDDIFTTPTLNLVGDFLSYSTTTMSFVGNTLYGFQTGGALGNDHRLVTIDIGGLTDAPVGQTGIFGQQVGGSAYDATTDTLYTVLNGSDSTAALASIDDYTVISPNDPSQTQIGILGERSINNGADFRNGTLYTILQAPATGGSPDLKMTLGTINTGSGAFSTIEVVLDDFVAPSGFPGSRSVGFAVIPAPGAMAMLMPAGIIASRRRR